MDNFFRSRKQTRVSKVNKTNTLKNYPLINNNNNN